MVTTSTNTAENMEKLAKSMGRVVWNDDLDEKRFDHTNEIFDWLQDAITDILSIQKHYFDFDAQLFHKNLNAAAHHLVNANSELSKALQAAEDSEKTKQ